MLAYAARAVPWRRVALAAALVVALMELVRWDAWTLWPLQGTAVGLLAGAAAWSMDEASAVVVDTTPRGLAWRTMARGPAVVLLALVWVMVCLRAGAVALFGHREAVLVQGLVAIAAGLAYACWRRAHGAAMPGLLFATAVVPGVTAWALARLFDDQLAVFPYGTTSAHGWQLSTVGWLVLGVLAVLMIVAALAEVPWWGLRRLSGRVPETAP